MLYLIEFAIKNIWRQKTRSLLTVIGIMIGIAAIVALGSISEGLQVTITKNLEEASGLITVIQKSDQGMISAMATGKISESTAEEVEKVGGVKDVARIIMQIAYTEETSTFGQPDLFFTGIEPSQIEIYATANVKLKEGELLEEGDTYDVVLGELLADKLNAGVGDTVYFKDVDFTVKGIIEKMGDTSTDYGFIVPLDIAKEVTERDDYSVLIVLPENIDDVSDVAKDIGDSFDDLTAFTTEEFAKQISNVIDQIRFFTIGIGAISAIVGGLGVMNTMIMSVMERRREIGILKAIGATRTFIIKQILVESSILSLIGGLAGVMLGEVGSISIRFISQGLAFAQTTPQLIIYSLSFSLVLGVIGGLYPSSMAAKLDPIEALRYE
jgi:putative ABC transport system permease protein